MERSLEPEKTGVVPEEECEKMMHGFAASLQGRLRDNPLESCMLHVKKQP